jgi:exopolysaccharide production protein ExoQ
VTSRFVNWAPEKPTWHYALPWILVLPMLAFAAAGQFSFQTGSRNVAGAGLLAGGDQVQGERWVLLISYLIITVVLLRRFRPVFRIAVEMTAMTALATLTIISALWSQFPAISAVRGTYYLLDTFFIYWLIQKYSAEQLRTFVIMVGSVVAVLSVLMVVAFPQYGIVHQATHAGAWQGMFSEKNAAGKVLVFLLAPVVDFRKRPTLLRLLYGVTILGLIGMSQSRTAWLIAAAFILFMFVLHIAKRAEGRLVLLMGLVSSLGLTVAAGFVASDLAGHLSMIGRDATLSGRTDVWREVTRSIAGHPWLGYGFQSFWNGTVGESGRIILTLKWNFGYAHNGFLEVLLQLGVVGLAIVAYLVCKGLKDALFCFRYSSQSGVPWYIGLLFLTILYNLDEETFLFPHQIVSLFFLLACCGLSIARKEAICEVEEFSSWTEEDILATDALVAVGG